MNPSSYARLPERFYARVAPTPVAAPRLVKLNVELAKNLGLDPNALATAIERDRRAGHTPFLVVGTAGTVDTGAVDRLDLLSDICRSERLWFHVDGACGALAILAPDLAPLLKGIECADSLAFDFHKWGQVPYDAGFILVRDGVLHRNAFSASICSVISVLVPNQRTTLPVSSRMGSARDRNQR